MSAISAAYADSGGRSRPSQLVSAAVTFDKVEAGFRIISSALTVRGWVPGLDAEGFRKAAESAKDGCPVSQALKGNVKLSLAATLAG